MDACGTDDWLGDCRVLFDTVVEEVTDVLAVTLTDWDCSWFVCDALAVELPLAAGEGAELVRVATGDADTLSSTDDEGTLDGAEVCDAAYGLVGGEGETVCDDVSDTTGKGDADTEAAAVVRS